MADHRVPRQACPGNRAELKALLTQLDRLLSGRAVLFYPEESAAGGRKASRGLCQLAESLWSREEAGAVQRGSLGGIPLYRRGKPFAVLTVDCSGQNGGISGTEREDISAVLEILAPLLELYLPDEEKSEEPPDSQAGPEWVGDSPLLGQVESMAHRAAATESPVLISGESGTGKEVLAEMIHSRSSRRSGPLVKVNMAALAPGVLESELFGHVRGAFTDAHQDRRGVFEQAAGGTLFLDEIGEMPLELQGRLLQVLQEGVYRRVGDSQLSHSRVRILAATHRDLSELIASGDFRQDLYYRLNVIPLKIPPLRDHPEDIPVLCRHFLEKYRVPGQSVPSILPETEESMLRYDWPGNVRELENAIQRAVVMAPGKGIRPQDLFGDPPEGQEKPKKYHGKGLKEAVNLFKKRFIEHNLAVNGGNKTRTAQALGIQRTYLSRLIKELDINNERLPQEGEGEHVSG